MAEQIITLTPPKRYESPYKWFNVGNYDGGDTIVFSSGVFRDIPIVWKVCKLKVSLTCSAVVANRNPRIGFYLDGAIQNIVLITGDTVAASATGTLGLTDFSIVSSSVGVTFDDYVGAYEEAFVVSGLDQFRITIVNNQAGDLFACRAQLKYMNKELGLPDPYSFDFLW